MFEIFCFSAELTDPAVFAVGNVFPKFAYAVGVVHAFPEEVAKLS
jgi:hypothetical protein